jgi:hypothetical protein
MSIPLNYIKIMIGYFNFNRLMLRAEKLSFFACFLIGTKIALILLPPFWLFSHFILGR